ncbi:MAG: outer membrane beta-barrel protein [Thermodesulfobacteriota bacterium]|nr:outer membrane beta-barrel protein [Thermodesulfobacteriota bacterium]
MKIISGKTCVVITVFVALVALIPAGFHFSKKFSGSLPRPLMAQEIPSKNPHTNSRPGLETIRGGRHELYGSIVFQFSGKVHSIRPVIKGNEICFQLTNVATDLRPFRKYRTFDSWVRLDKAGHDLDVRVGLPQNFVQLRSFLMENPDRLVINLYDRESEALSKPQDKSLSTRVSPPCKIRIVIASRPVSSAPVGEVQHAPFHNPIPGPEGDQGEESLDIEQEASEEHSAKDSHREISAGSKGGTTGGGAYHGAIGSSTDRYRVKITPKISIKTEYDDNIFLNNTNKKSDFITTVSPGIIMDIHSDKTGLKLDYTFGWVRYDDFSENDFMRHNGRFNFWQRLGKRLKFNLEDSYLKSDDLFDEAFAPDLGPQRIRHTRTPYHRNDASAGLEYKLGPESNFTTGFRHAFLDNEDPSLEDVTEYSPFARLSYWFNKRDGMELGYEYRRFDYTVKEGLLPGTIDLDAQDIEVAYVHRFGRRSKVYARYGFALRNFKGIPVSYHVHDGSIGFEHNFSRDTSLSLDIGYFNPSGDMPIDGGFEYNMSFRKRFKRGSFFLAAQSGWDEGFMDVEPRAFTRYWGGDAGVDYRPWRDFETYAGVDYRKNNYAFSEQDDDDSVGGRCGVRLRFLRWFSADLGYTHRRRISDDPNNKYDDNRVTFTISASKPHPYNWEF